MPSNRNDGCPRLGNMIGRSADADDGDIATPFSSYLPIWFHPHLIAVLTGRQLYMTASNLAKSPKIMLKKNTVPLCRCVQECYTGLWICATYVFVRRSAMFHRCC